MLLSQIIATMISTVKFKRNDLPFTIEDILKGEFNWNMYEIAPPCDVINTCLSYRLYSKQHGFLKEELIGYTHANFHRATRFGCRNIELQIWWSPCNPHRSEWPKTFFGRCIYLYILAKNEDIRHAVYIQFMECLIASFLNADTCELTYHNCCVSLFVAKFLSYKGPENGISFHDDVIKWKHFPRYWPFVQGIHRSPVKSISL